jgi:broad specificity phosphatase PhoE
MEQKWPQQLWLVRHGQSAGNVARDAAEASKQFLIDIADRDVDVPLSELGQRQAAAMSEWFHALGSAGQPTVVLHSPYVRARATAKAVLDRLDRDGLTAIAADERLRKRNSASSTG